MRSGTGPGCRHDEDLDLLVGRVRGLLFRLQFHRAGLYQADLDLEKHVATTPVIGSYDSSSGAPTNPSHPVTHLLLVLSTGSPAVPAWLNTPCSSDGLVGVAPGMVGA